MTARSEPPTRVHFWSPEALPAQVHGWDPDEEPHLYADGFGHNVLELYARLRRAGHPVSIGPGAPSGARLVVFLPSLLTRRAQAQLFRSLLRRRQVDLLVIRSDFLLSYQLPVAAGVEVMPNQASVTMGNQTWLPPLPQRGLIPRAAGRGSAVDSLGYKGYPENLPASMVGAEWARRLSSLGVCWRPDVRDPLTGVNRWHDFSDVDVALCLRSDGPAVGLLRKPATKMINAWVAGAIPLVGREPGYLELAHHREDAMVVCSPDDVVEVLSELRARPELAARLREGARRRADEFRTARVLELWEEQLLRPLAERPVLSTRSVAGMMRVVLRLGVDAARGDRESAIWQADR